MVLPAVDDRVIQGDCLLDRFCPRAVVGSRIIFLGTLGSRHQVKNRTILISHFIKGQSHAVDDIVKFLISHICFIVKHTPVTDNKDLLLRHGPRGLLKNPLLLHLQGALTDLVVKIGSAGPRRYSAADEFCRRFRHEKHYIAPPCKGVLDPAHGSCLACARTARYNDFGNLLHDIPPGFINLERDHTYNPAWTGHRLPASCTLILR